MKRMGICIAAAVIALGLLLAGCTKKDAIPSYEEQRSSESAATTPTAEEQTPSAPESAGAAVAELTIEDLKVGDGAEATTGSTVTVHYTGWLTDGKKFDSSLDRNQPFDFTIGAGEVIAGWEKGVVGMKVGGKRKLTIPSELGYGARGIGPIPPNATLVFEVELLKVELLKAK